MFVKNYAQPLLQNETFEASYSDVNNGRSSDMSDRFEILAGQIKAKTREMSEQNN